MAYGDKEGEYFNQVRRQFVAFQRGDSEQIPAKPTGGDALQIYKRAMLNAALNASGNGYGSVGHKLYAKYFGTMYANESSYGVNEKGEYDENLVALLDEDKDGEIEHHFGSVGDKAKVPAGKGYEFAGAMAIASAAAKTYKAFEAGRRATPAEMAVNVTGWQDGLKKKYGKTYDTGFTVSGGDYDGPVISTINKAMGDNSDKLSLPSSFKAPGLVDAPGLPKAPAAPKTSVPKTDGSLSYIPGLSGSAPLTVPYAPVKEQAPTPKKAPAAPAAKTDGSLSYIPGLSGSVPLTVPYAPGKSPGDSKPATPAPAQKAQTAVTKFTKDESCYDVAVRELSRSGLVSQAVINAASDAFNVAGDLADSSDAAMTASFKKDYHRTHDPKYIYAMAILKRGNEIGAAQEAGKTSLPVPTQAEILAFAKDPFGNKPISAPQKAPATPAPTQQAPAPAPTAPAAPVPDAAADAPEAPAKVNYKKAKLLATSKVEANTKVLDDVALVDMAKDKKYLWRGAHWVADAEQSAANQTLIQQLERSLDRVEGKEVGVDGSDDGVYGGGVEARVHAIQRQYGLLSKHGKTDGIAGRQTITALQTAELTKVLEAGADAGVVLDELKDVEALLVSGKKLPAKVAAEIKTAIEKIEKDVAPSVNGELLGALTESIKDIRTKAGLTK